MSQPPYTIPDGFLAELNSGLYFMTGGKMIRPLGFQGRLDRLTFVYANGTAGVKSASRWGIDGKVHLSFENFLFFIAGIRIDGWIRCNEPFRVGVEGMFE